MVITWFIGGVGGGAVAYILGQLGVDFVGQMLGAVLVGIVVGLANS